MDLGGMSGGPVRCTDQDLDRMSCGPVQRRRRLQRLLRPQLLLRLCLVAFFVVSAGRSYVEYASEPTFSQVQMEPADLPAFTICTALRANTTLIRRGRNNNGADLALRLRESPKLQRWISETNASVRDIYNKTSLDFTKHGLPATKFIAGANESVETDPDFVGWHVRAGRNTGSWWRTYATGSSCYMYKPNGRQYPMNVPFMGPVFSLKVYPEFVYRNKYIQHAYTVWVHGVHHPHWGRQLYSDVEYVPKVMLMNSSAVRVEINIKRYRTLSLRRAACNGTAGYARSNCMAACVYDQQIRLLGCAMLYMQRPDVRTCTLMEVNQHYLKMQPFVSRCSCLPACQNDIIQATVDISSLMPLPNRSRVQFDFHYTVDARVMYLKENFLHFLVNIGGLIGLLLGWSLLSIGESSVRALGNICRTSTGDGKIFPPQRRNDNIIIVQPKIHNQIQRNDWHAY